MQFALGPPWIVLHQDISVTDKSALVLRSHYKVRHQRSIRDPTDLFTTAAAAPRFFVRQYVAMVGSALHMDVVLEVSENRIAGFLVALGQLADDVAKTRPL